MKAPSALHTRSNSCRAKDRLTIASTGKNLTTDRLETREYCVEEAVTGVDLDEELRNRCIVLTVDDHHEQTRAIHELQRMSETLAGGRPRRKQQVLRHLALALVLLRESRWTDHHPHPSGPIDYIEVTPSGIALANAARARSTRPLLDELVPQTRWLLATIYGAVARERGRRAMARCDYRFTNREVREWGGWSDLQVRTDVYKLITMEVHACASRRTWAELCLRIAV